MDNLTRLNKFIASNGISSRRKIDELITQGRVTVNGNTVSELGYKIDPEKDKIQLDGENIRVSTKKIYIVLNKPAGVITSVSDEKKRTTVIDLLNLNEKVFPVGRLDYNTTGLLLMTNDGEIAHKLMHPKSEIYKTYFVKLSKPLEEKHRIKLTGGINLEDRKTAPCKIRYPKKNNNYQDLFISIYEGRNRQVRNMFEHYGYFVRELERVEYAGLKMDDLRSGEWRKLTAEEVTKMQELVKDIPTGNTKRVHYAKKEERKDYKKYKVRDERGEAKRDPKKYERRDDTKSSKWGHKDKLTAERDARLGFRKIDADDESKDTKRDYKKFDRSDDRRGVKKDFKKFGKSDDKKFEKRDFKKSGTGYGKSDEKKFEKRDFKKSFGKSDDKKYEKRDFKKSGTGYGKSDDKKYEKKDFKKTGTGFGKSDDKKYEKRDFKKTGTGYGNSDEKKFEKRDFKKSFGKSDDKKYEKRDFKKSGTGYGKSDDKKYEKKDFKKTGTGFGKSDDKKYEKRDFKKSGTGYGKSDDKKYEKKDFKKSFKKKY